MTNKPRPGAPASDPAAIRARLHELDAATAAAARVRVPDMAAARTRAAERRELYRRLTEAEEDT